MPVHVFNVQLLIGTARMHKIAWCCAQNFSGVIPPDFPMWEGVTVRFIHIWGRAPTGIYLATGLSLRLLIIAMLTYTFTIPTPTLTRRMLAAVTSTASCISITAVDPLQLIATDNVTWRHKATLDIISSFVKFLFWIYMVDYPSVFIAC